MSNMPLRDWFQPVITMLDNNVYLRVTYGTLVCPLCARSLVEDGINPDARLKVVPLAVGPQHFSLPWG